MANNGGNGAIGSSGSRRREKTTLTQLSLSFEGSAYDNFVNAIRSETTKNNYIFALKRYMQYQNVSRLQDLISSQDTRLIEARIIAYLVHLKKIEKIGFGTINGYLAAITLFYAVQDINLNRKKMARYLPERHRPQEDRGYTTEEIAKMLSISDNRLKALILLIASTGIRIGAVASIKLKHLHKIEKYNLYKVIIYPGYKEEYFCFTTVEAAKAIDTYLEYR
jgi:integrase